MPISLDSVVGYEKESFSSLMEVAMEDESWYQLLTDLDKYEDWCSMGYFGSPHVDIPRAAKLYLDKKEEAHYHLRECNSIRIMILSSMSPKVHLVL